MSFGAAFFSPVKNQKKNILFSFSPARHSLADAAHSSSPYVRYHWSVSATTQASPERDTTARSGSE